MRHLEQFNNNHLQEIGVQVEFVVQRQLLSAEEYAGAFGHDEIALRFVLVVQRVEMEVSRVSFEQSSDGKRCKRSNIAIRVLHSFQHSLFCTNSS